MWRGLSHLAAFTCGDVSEVRLHGGVEGPPFLASAEHRPLQGWATLFITRSSGFVINVADGGFCPLSGNCESCCCDCVALWCRSLGHTPRSGTAGCHGRRVFRFRRSCQLFLTEAAPRHVPQAAHREALSPCPDDARLCLRVCSWHPRGCGVCPRKPRACRGHWLWVLGDVTQEPSKDFGVIPV